MQRSWMWHRVPWCVFCAIDMIRNISGIFWKDGGVPVGAKYGLTISKSKKSVARTQSHVKNPINLTLRSKFKVVSGSWMYATHRLMVIHPCAKYGKPMSNHKKVMGRTRICTDRRTDRRTGRVKPISHQNFVCGGYKQRFCKELWLKGAPLI